MNVNGYNFIAGRRSGQGDTLVFGVDAHTGERLPGGFRQATLDEVDAAVMSAASAFTTFRNLAATRRAEFLEAIADEVDALGEDFIALVSQETALPSARIMGERGRTSGQMRLFAQVLRRGNFYSARIDQALPARSPLPRPDLRQYRIGVGPVAVFGASNFPLAFSTAGGDTAAALAAGCPVVFKAHSGHMATAEQVAEAVIRAADRTGMPPGVFNMIFGSGVGEALVKHPGIQAVGFTGSLKGGRALFDMAAARPCPIPVFAEMSSINPVLVLPQALANRGESIARELTASVVQGCGQFCTNPGLVLGIRSTAFSAFINELAGLMAKQPAQTMLNPSTLNSYRKGIQALQAHPNIKKLSGFSQEGTQAQPHLFEADVSLLLAQDELLQEEVFGPCTVVVQVADEDELAQAINALQGQLTATLQADSEDLTAYGHLLSTLEIKAGRVLLNGYPTGVEVSDAMVHGGPYPATSDARGTSVGTLAIDRFLRPVCYQNIPDSLLPAALQNANPLGIQRLVDGKASTAAIG